MRRRRGSRPPSKRPSPDILPDEERYTRALSLSRLANDLDNLLSPAVAALLLAVTSYHAFFVLNGAAFVLSALLVSPASLPNPSRTGRPAGIIHNLTFGMRTYLATPRLRGLLLLSFGVAASGAMVIVSTVVQVRDLLDRSA